MSLFEICHVIGLKEAECSNRRITGSLGRSHILPFDDVDSNGYTRASQNIKKVCSVPDAFDLECGLDTRLDLFSDEFSLDEMCLETSRTVMGYSNANFYAA
ncbi:hypothetical protein TNCV_3524301 [Trichonephila clavipes]|uniref:Uncharacterized protein n=1 Tax=Trichonephila clavipes TaxID=2585209 RepID=A0A8X6VBK9_TRICX|nr:hypothetical protein TNCV_3524301 [Trichonephila clavipes]